MQTVLSIDISSNKAEAVVANIEGNNVQVLERHHLDITDFLVSLLNLQNGASPASENNLSEAAVPGEEGEAETASSSPTNLNPISQMLSKITSKWNNAILTVPSQDYLSLNMDLPFNDNKSINRILDLEIQDLVPFEISDFHLCHKSISASPLENDLRFDTHIGIIAKDHINTIMDLCHQANFEPFIVTTPCSALGAVFTLAPLYFAENSMILLERLPEYYLITCFDGMIRSEKIISLPNFTADTNGTPKGGISETDKLILLDLKLFIASGEKRYRKNIEKIYYFGQRFSNAELQHALARSIEVLNLNEFLPLQEAHSSVAALASVYAEENNSSTIVNNFRARQHAYNQKLKYILRSSKALLPYLSLLLGAFAFYLGCVYLVNEYKISRINSAINTEIKNTLPSLNIEEGHELQALQGENQKLESQLNDISSLSNMTPLDLLLEISKDLPSSLGLSVKAVKIKDAKIVVEGSAKGYSDVENVRKILEKKPLYQRVKKGETAGNVGNGMRPFSFEIWIKE